ncbi:hypothetical protein [Streptosporangium carneum]|uniref:Lipoprotein n=1 Tax=Streptosporangium carneum TaxID=47481 RepID=A0A9W6HYQ6_9ACTN|nr:hypothetical protein [Streptosporangium carneum]GLK08523.1 hypothetical protein GCM10017600_19280 [Streptosporangium carneum]
MSAQRSRALLVLALLSAGLAGCSAPPARPFVPGDLPADPSASSQEAGAPTPRTETVEVAPGVRLEVEWPAAPDQDTTGMINAFRDHTAGTFRAVVTAGKDVSYLDTVEGEAVRDASAWVQEFLEQRRSVSGTARLYALSVTSVSGRGAQLDACVDESGMRLLDSATGERVSEQPEWTREPFLQAAGMRRGDDGVWRVALLRHAEPPSERAKGCLQ